MSLVRPRQSLDAARLRLEGTGLVEANAGTGKTFSITTLYVRLLIEKGLSVDRILVVSFTEAATAELRIRIRARLIATRDALTLGHCDDASVAASVSGIADRALASRQLTRALQSFDEAAIHTIHGFCQRLLAENGFESGALADTELIADDGWMRREIVDDFWRRETQTGSRLWLGWLLDHAAPQRLADQMQRHFGRPAQVRLAPATEAPQAALEQRFLRQALELRRRWPEQRETIATRLREATGLNRNRYSVAVIDGMLNAADDWFGTPPALSGLRAKHLRKFGMAAIVAARNKTGEIPQDPFFEDFQALLDSADALSEHFGKRLAHFREQLLSYADRELPRRKRARRLRHYDDLLHEVHAALRTPMAVQLREQLRYEVALIDEFQDTDPVQYDIFERLFCRADKPVFMVGDPKQSIYSFRGADVFAYLDAREDADATFLLNDNYRSTPALVAAINELFSRPSLPFVIDDIGYSPSRAAREIAGLFLDGQELAAFHWWCIEGEGDRRPGSAQARSDVAEATATEITRLLRLAHSGRLTIGAPSAPAVEARDIAVLVRSHVEGDEVRAALAARGVGCVQRTEQSVFASNEAFELAVVLRAVAHPANARAVRAALATDLLGFSVTDIADVAADDERWQQLLEDFAGYHADWRRRGYAPMQRELLRNFGVERRVLALADGRRRLTNLGHLEDLLQHESTLRRASPDELLLWMKAQRDADTGSEQSLLRLDSDENLVRIMTVHYAKGLQFPIVFAPFLYSSVRKANDGVVEFHDEQRQPALDLGSAEIASNRERKYHEDFAEATRLAYVALTRAERLCVTAWGPVQGAQRSPLAWLLHSADGESPEALEKRLAALPVEQWCDPLRRARAANVVVSALPAAGSERIDAEPAASGLQARELRAPPAPGWRVSSFSALVRSQTEQPRDYDAMRATAPGAADPDSIFGFARGARAGRAMHALFERIAFDAPVDQIRQVALEVLREHGFERESADVLTAMVDNVLHTPLYPDGHLRLRDITASQRIDEMEFYFPTAGLDAARMRAALGDFGGDAPIGKRIEALDFALGHGFIHGFVDLVFAAGGRYYIVDYKSNWLGDRPEDYAGAALDGEIARHDYYLQYLIYTVAVNRHLGKVVPDYDYDENFGGVLYLFLRAMVPAHGAGCGIYRDRPDAALVRRLERALCGTPS